MHASSQKKFCLSCFLNRFWKKNKKEVVLIKMGAIVLPISVDELNQGK